jgi:16S rRNA (guanine(966)-N(2))-methyltransferase RsmD
MRVISGTLRGKRLATLKGELVRPTPDRVKEALFNILQNRLGAFSGLAILDLFSGSGALAIEALSRGASRACLVEKTTLATKVIHKNLISCHLLDKAEIIKKEVHQFIKGCSPDSFDLVFLDPPYGLGLAERTIKELEQHHLLRPGATICAETGSEEVLPEKIGTLERFDQRSYSSVMIHFYQAQHKGLP